MMRGEMNARGKQSQRGTGQLGKDVSAIQLQAAEQRMKLVEEHARMIKPHRGHCCGDVYRVAGSRRKEETDAAIVAYFRRMHAPSYADKRIAAYTGATAWAGFPSEIAFELMRFMDVAFNQVPGTTDVAPLPMIREVTFLGCGGMTYQDPFGGVQNTARGIPSILPLEGKFDAWVQPAHEDTMVPFLVACECREEHSHIVPDHLSSMKKRAPKSHRYQRPDVEDFEMYVDFPPGSAGFGWQRGSGLTPSVMGAPTMLIEQARSRFLNYRNEFSTYGHGPAMCRVDTHKSESPVCWVVFGCHLVGQCRYNYAIGIPRELTDRQWFRKWHFVREGEYVQLPYRTKYNEGYCYV